MIGGIMMSDLTPREIPISELESSFRSMSLRELSFEAAQIAALVEESEADELLEQLQGYLEKATEAKIDGYCLYKEYLDSEIEAWKTKRDALLAICSCIISAKEAQLKALKQNLLSLYEQGLVGERLAGKNKAIEIRPNPKPAVEVLGNPEDLPEQYRKPKWVADKEAIAEDYLKGVDVSDFATVGYGQQVRFKNAPRTGKREK